MSQATASNTYGYGNESMGVGSKPVASGGAVTIPFEVISTYADQSLVAQIEELKRMLAEAQQNILKKDETIQDQRNALGDMSLELHKVKKENEQVYKQLQEKGTSATNNASDFYPVIDCRKFHSKDKKMPTNKWVVAFWQQMYEFVSHADENGKFVVCVAEDIVPIYKVMTESTSMPYKFVGTREDFEYQWNENVVARIEDKMRAKKLTCKHKTLNTALGQPCWKGVSPSSWRNLALTSSEYMDKYDKGCLIKKSIERFSA